MTTTFWYVLGNTTIWSPN